MKTGLTVISLYFLGTLIGFAAGAEKGSDEKILIVGKSTLEIREILEKLRKKARIKNFQ